MIYSAHAPKPRARILCPTRRSTDIIKAECYKQKSKPARFKNRSMRHPTAILTDQSLGHPRARERSVLDGKQHMKLIGSWAALSLFFKTFIVFFCFVSIYTLSVSLRVPLSLRAARKQAGSGGSLQAFTQFDSLQKRMANLRQIQGFALYLFGLCLSMQVPNAFKTLDSSKSFPFRQSWRN